MLNLYVCNYSPYHKHFMPFHAALAAGTFISITFHFVVEVYLLSSVIHNILFVDGCSAPKHPTAQTQTHSIKCF